MTSRDAGRTQAAEAVDLVVAAAAVEARRAGALVHVALTVLAAETRSAHTFITVDQVLRETRTEIHSLGEEHHLSFIRFEPRQFIQRQ